MEQPKRMLCIMDLSGVGRSSLAVVLPVLAACGVQACPLPTALFSTHTGGFGQPSQLDTAVFCQDALQHYKEQDIPFDGIYIGYLCTQAQFALAEAAIAQYPDAFVIVDPAMGDNGRLYSSITNDMVGWMQNLCRKASLITPNYTESALLLDEIPTQDPLSAQMMNSRLCALAAFGGQVLVTSVPTPHKTMEIWGSCPGGEGKYTISAYHVPQNYPGTGDLYTSTVAGLALRRRPIPDAAQIAADFVRSAAIRTLQSGGDPRQGVWFETQISMLTLAANGGT